MSNQDDIHALLGELREFKRASLTRLEKIDQKLDQLQSFRMKLLGAAGFISFMISIMATVLVDWFRK